MPGPFTHRFLVAQGARLLGANDSLLPYFLEGSLAPDMGVFPGCRMEISELSHYNRTGELAQRLINRSANEVERAFALGWLSHYIADIALHPLINAAVGRFLHGEHAASIPWSRAPDIHLRIELGFDGAFALSQPESLPRYTTTRLPESIWAMLHAAYHELYDREIAPELFKASHCRALGFHERLLRLAEIQAAKSLQRPIPKTAYRTFWDTYLPLRAFALFLKPPAIRHALAHLEQPSATFFTEAVAIIQGATTRFTECAAAQQASQATLHLPNINLDTGAPCESFDSLHSLGIDK